MYRVLEKPHTHFLRRFFFLNTDNQSSPILKNVEGEGEGAFFTVNAVLVARKLEGDQVLINNVFFFPPKGSLVFREGIA